MSKLPLPISSSTNGDRAAIVRRFRESKPVRHVVIDDFLDADSARALEATFPIPDEMPKSRDYVFSNKYELSSVDLWNDESKALHHALTGPEFAQFLGDLFDDEIFVDAEYLGGGFHAGPEGSFLDLHVDFNVHPLHSDWLRRANILVYLNPGWEPAFGGQLLLTDDPKSPPTLIEPLFNRAVIMESTDFSFHGYNRINFPPGTSRKSIASYGYSSIQVGSVPVHTTEWRPQDSGVAKTMLARNWSRIVLTKNRFFGSATAKNRQ